MPEGSYDGSLVNKTARKGQSPAVRGGGSTGIHMGLIHKKTQRPKISFYCLFKRKSFGKSLY